MRNEQINSRDLTSSETQERERLVPQAAVAVRASASATGPAAPQDVTRETASQVRKPRMARRRPETDEQAQQDAAAADGEKAGADTSDDADQPVQLAMLDQPAGDGASGAPSESGDTRGDSRAGAPDGGGNNTLLYALGGLALVGGGLAAAAGGGGSNSGGGNSGGTPADTTPPAAPTIALQTDTGASNSDRITSNGAVTVGNLEAGATWEFSTNNGTSWTAGSGTSFTIPAGSYAAGAVQVRQKDAAGNVSAVGSIAGTVSIDGTAPSAPVIAQVAGDDTVNLVEKTAGVSVTGTAEAGSRVTVTWGATSKDVTADASGAWTASFASAEIPGNGTSSITARTVDVAGNASTNATRSVTIATTATVAGQIVAGPLVTGHGLTVDLYSGSGTLLKSGVAVSAQGNFTTTLDVAAGTVVVARVVDANSGADYRDEARDAPTDLNAQLLAATVVTGNTVTLNINPLTTIAALKAGLAADGTGNVTATAVAGANTATAVAFGIAGVDILTTAVTPTNGGSYDVSNGLSSGERLGAILAAISGFDGKNGGDAQATINQFAAALTVTGTAGVLSDEALAALLEGAVLADPAVTGSLQTELSNLLSTLSGGTSIGIAAVGTDNIVNAAEAAGLTVSGTVSASATRVSLKVGDVSADALVTDGTWYYTFTAADVANLGADGIKVLKAEAVFDGGATSTAVRPIVLDRTGPAKPVLEPVAGDNAVNAVERAAGVTLSGTGEPGSSVTVAWAGASKTVPVNASGAWTAAFVSSEIATGATTIVTVTPIDANGNAGTPETREIVVDTTPPGAPTVNLVAGDDVVGVIEAQSAVAVSGTADANASVRVGWGNVTKSVTANASGLWTASFGADELPADGIARISATQLDAVGNVSAAGTRDVRLAKAPTAPIINTIAGDNRVNLSEAADGVVVSGVAQPGSVVQLNWNGVSRTASTNPNGSWSAIIPIADLPADGEANVTATATSASGVALGSNTVRVQLDTTAPLAPTLVAIATDNIINAQEKTSGVTLSGTGEANATLELAWAGLTKTATVGANGNWSLQLNSAEIPADGNRELAISQLDAAGNRSAELSRSIRIDTDVPTAPQFALAADTGESGTDGLTSAGSVAVTGLAVGTIWEYSTDRGATWTQGSGGSFTLDEGRYAIGDVRVRQTDSAGNVSSVTANSGVLEIDQASPDLIFEQVTNDDIINQGEKNAGVTVSGTTEPFATVTLSWGGTTKSVKAAANGFWSVLYEAAEVPADGARDITASVVDRAGNQVAFPALPITVDTAAPAAPQIQLFSDTGSSGSDRITSDGTITVGGLEIGAQWQYSTDGGISWKDGDVDSFELEAKSYTQGTVQVRQIDAAGNIGTPATLAHALTVDKSVEKPTIDDVAGDNIVNAPERVAGVNVSGKAEPFAAVSLTWGGATKSAVANAQGVWTTTFSTTDIPADGATSIQAVQTDPAGNVSEAQLFTVTVNTVAPPKPTISAVTDFGTVNGAEKAAGVEVTGTADAGATVEVSWGGVPKTVTAGTNGAWSARYEQAEVPADGTTTVTARQINAIGNPSTAEQRQVIVDTVANAPVISEVAGNGIVNASERAGGVEVSGTAEAGSTVTVNWGTVTKTKIADGSGGWTVEFEASEVPAEGLQPVTASIVDQAGNVSTVTRRDIRVDTIAPLTPELSSIATDDIVTPAERSAGVSVTGRAEAGATVLVTWEGGATREAIAGADGNWTVNFASGDLPTNGDRNVSAVAVDAAGNRSNAAARVVTVSDAAAGALVIAPISTDNVVNLAEINKGVRISGIAAPNSNVSITWGNVTKPATTTSTGAWTTSFSTAEIPADGNREVTVTSNGATVTRMVTVDATPPSAPALDPVAINNIVNLAEKTAGVTVSGTAGANDTVTLTWSGVTKTAVANASGVFSTTFASAEIPTDGGTSLSARATDAAGNVGPSISRSIIVDTAAPAAPTFSAISGDNVVSATERTSDVVIGGTGEAGAKVSVTWQGVTQTVDVGTDGSWSATYTPAQIVTSGSTTVTAVQIDAAGNVSGQTTQTVTVGAIPPDADPTGDASAVGQIAGLASILDLGGSSHGSVDLGSGTAGLGGYEAAGGAPAPFDPTPVIELAPAQPLPNSHGGQFVI